MVKGGFMILNMCNQATGGQRQRIDDVDTSIVNGGLLPKKRWSMSYESLAGPVRAKERLDDWKGRKRHSPEQIVKKLRDGEAMLNAGKDLAVVLQSLEVSEATYHRWRNQYGGMKSEKANRLSELEDENRRLKQHVADLSLDNQKLKHVASKNW